MLLKLLPLLGAIAYSRKAPIIPSACPHVSARLPLDRIFIKFDIANFYENLPTDSKFDQYRTKNPRPFTWWTTHDLTSPNVAHWDKIIFCANTQIFLYWQWLVAQRQTENNGTMVTRTPHKVTFHIRYFAYLLMDRLRTEGCNGGHSMQSPVASHNDERHCQ